VFGWASSPLRVSKKKKNLNYRNLNLGFKVYNSWLAHFSSTFWIPLLILGIYEETFFEPEASDGLLKKGPNQEPTTLVIEAFPAISSLRDSGIESPKPISLFIAQLFSDFGDFSKDFRALIEDQVSPSFSNFPLFPCSLNRFFFSTSGKGNQGLSICLPICEKWPSRRDMWTVLSKEVRSVLSKLLRVFEGGAFSVNEFLPNEDIINLYLCIIRFSLLYPRKESRFRKMFNSLRNPF